MSHQWQQRDPRHNHDDDQGGDQWSERRNTLPPAQGGYRSYGPGRGSTSRPLPGFIAPTSGDTQPVMAMRRHARRRRARHSLLGRLFAPFIHVSFQVLDYDTRAGGYVGDVRVEAASREQCKTYAYHITYTFGHATALRRRVKLFGFITHYDEQDCFGYVLMDDGHVKVVPFN